MIVSEARRQWRSWRGRWTRIKRWRWRRRRNCQCIDKRGQHASHHCARLGRKGRQRRQSRETRATRPRRPRGIWWIRRDMVCLPELEGLELATLTFTKARINRLRVFVLSSRHEIRQRTADADQPRAYGWQLGRTASNTGWSRFSILVSPGLH